jgi:hypothetical protein
MRSFVSKSELAEPVPRSVPKICTQVANCLPVNQRGGQVDTILPQG